VRPASAAEKARLNDTFAALCAIRSPSWQEQACAAWVKAELEAMGLGAEADDTGNLLARVPGRGDRTLLLCAHLDTVEPLAPIEPVLVEDGWENAHDGILGADNKAAVAVILEAARRCSIEGGPVALELVFTVAEEVGLCGAKRFDVSRSRADLAYAFDHATPIGEIVVASPTYYSVEADFHGKAAHAGIRPEEGHSAILAAARAVAAMPLGRLDPETTANVGTITGGSSSNVVAERCRLQAEARSLDADRAETVVARLVDAIYDGAADAECDVDVVTEKQFTGYRFRLSDPAIAVAEAALRACGYEPRHIHSGGGSDANAFEAAGLHCVNLANGTERNHEPGERVSVAALEGMLDVALALIESAA
jgi:tripeptide aminopeptidase